MTSLRSNDSPKQKSPNSSDVHDIPIIPPHPAPRKEYKEIIPDISVVSDIADSGSHVGNFQNKYLGQRIQSQFFQVKPGQISKPLYLQNNLAPLTDIVYKNMQCSYEQNYRINSDISIPKASCHFTDRIDLVSNNNELPSTKNCFHPGCQCCQTVINQTASEKCDDQHVSHKSKSRHAYVPLNLIQEQYENDLKCPMDNSQCHLHKRNCERSERNKFLNSNHYPTFENHACYPSKFNSDEPSEMMCAKKMYDCHCSSNHSLDSSKTKSKHEDHVCFDSNTDKRKKAENNKNEEVGKDFFEDDILCKNCKNETCLCRSEIKTLKSTNNYTNYALTEENSPKNKKITIPYDELSNIWEYIKGQDERINLLNEQISEVLAQRNCHSSEKNELSKETESDIPYILNILEVHSDRIRELQQQINLLQQSVDKLLHLQNNKDNEYMNQVQTSNCIKKDICNEGTEQIKCNSNVVCHEQTKVTQTSTSTMTSLALENNEKLVYHKQLTVVTDFTKHKKEISDKHLSPKHSSPTFKTCINGKDIIPSSQERKSHRLSKNSQCLKPKTKKTTSNSTSEIPNSNDNQVLKSSHRRKTRQDMETKELIDQKQINFDSDDVSSPYRKKEPRSQSRPSRPKLRSHTSPKRVDTSIKGSRKHGTVIQKSASSSASTDSEHMQEISHRELDHYSDQQNEVYHNNDRFEESATISRYGLSSPNLSVATQRYLENYGLVRDRKDKTSSFKRYTR
ncbi:uncharacterized protein CDAR_237691 [Caerostris darwini]|uniref:Uncharacterized protein n=1 Tax=Caerostris darwini TaxID=1538125 RepID=A0AAV4NED3_9ARAC|nr:uncharacterized protein CDAR_237691 [Caerostris darwini]